MFMIYKRYYSALQCEKAAGMGKTIREDFQAG